MKDVFKEDILETIFEHIHQCIVIVDSEGYITYMNHSYCRFLEVDKSDVKGKHVTDVIENTRMHIVAKTGKEEHADLQHIKGNYMIANRIPLRSNGQVVGALGMVLYRDTEEWKQMNSHIKDLLSEMKKYRDPVNGTHIAKYYLHDIVGISSKINQLKHRIKKVATSDVSVLIRGESGTGKELIAHSIHNLSERSHQPFIKVNCAAIPEQLLESELFGYQEGAFTGAKKGGKQGKFQLADGGTLFLDEIGDMPLSAQVKILRVLQEGEVEALGSVEAQKVDVRLIAATNQPLEKRIAEQRFREDLFYRINVVPLHSPPLRERTEDLRLLCKYFLYKVTERIGKRVVDFTADVYQLFSMYHWPGNIRELENVIESAVHLTHKDVIEIEDIPVHLKQNFTHGSQAYSLKNVLEHTEKRELEKALQKCNGNKIEAAKLLKIGKSSMYDKLKKYELNESKHSENNSANPETLFPNKM
ncbi:sigma-54 interaction domain-containing protein [Caldalkalibacillus salinus]|uniref:sigma-54 interaction domain-containing protein n=1 Tax=Caldalkalibacillus salinus TaxID=2803787 RepID=UPI001920BDED|nr:sigma 54-interacting transcriptional regulator [Caldalkalibacillus salinus]